MKNININSPRYYELRFMPVYPYEEILGLTMDAKLDMLSKIITYLDDRNISVIFTDRMLDGDADIKKEWEIIDEKGSREIPIVELQGNLILINPRNIDFLSVLLSIGHIYGHLVQRMTPEKYVGITRFLGLLKPLNIENLLAQYKKEYGGDYKKDFLQYEIEAFGYAKHAFTEAGIEFNEMLDHAINVYIETDFIELWRWASETPNKTAGAFMNLYQKLFVEKKGQYTVLPAKKVTVEVVPDMSGKLTVVRDGLNETVYL